MSNQEPVAAALRLQADLPRASRSPSASALLRQRLQSSRLLGAPFRSAEEAVGWLGAVQAQDYAGAKWALGQRLRSATEADVERALQAGKILRTHVLRPTWHFVLPADIRWMLKLTAPRVRAVMAYYDRKLELDEATFRRSNAAIGKALQGGQQLTRSELARILEDVRIRASGQRLGQLLLRAELDAVVCSGPCRGKQFTYALLDERAPATRTVQRDEALAELTRRYVNGHGPCLVRDFSWWSGLSVSDAKRGIASVASELTHSVVNGKTYWHVQRPPPRSRAASLHLLPTFDEYLVAYKDHAPVLDGTLGPTENLLLRSQILLVNGQVAGGWRRILTKGRVKVEVTLLASLSAAEREALRRAAERYASFLGLSLELVAANKPRRRTE
jgi:hypothetical protein